MTRYQGKAYEIIRRGFCGDRSFYLLRSRFERTASFHAKISECEEIGR